MITVVALMCHMLGAIPEPVCFETVVAKVEMGMMECQVGAQVAVADWKANSIYAGEQWSVQRIICAPKNYIIKDAI